MRYYLTIERDKVRLVDQEPFDDYAAAMAACFAHCLPRFERSVLKFHTEAINGEFARSYAQLDLPERIDLGATYGKERYHSAVKASNAFIYDAPLFFLIESELGIADKMRFLEDEG